MLIDKEPELPSELEAEEAKLSDFSESKPEVPELPDRYRGKSIEDVVKMHQEAEKVIGRQAQEVGEVRKLADELIKQNLGAKSQPIEKQEPEVDFFEDPQFARLRHLYIFAVSFAERLAVELHEVRNLRGVEEVPVPARLHALQRLPARPLHLPVLRRA